jgi:hypothetical protein
VADVPVVGANPTPADATPKPNEGTGGGGAPAPQPPVQPATLEDALKELATTKESAEKLTKERSEFETKFNDITKKLGTQSQEVGALRKIQEIAKQRPKEFIAELAKEHGVDVKFADDDKSSLKDAYDADDPARLESIINMRIQNEVAKVRAELNPQIEAQFENNMRQKYADFDNLAETRGMLQAKVQAKQLPYTELFHLASQAVHLPEVLAAAEAAGRDKYIKELQSKGKDAHAAGGEQPNNPGAPAKELGTKEDVIAAVRMLKKHRF